MTKDTLLRVLCPRGRCQTMAAAAIDGSDLTILQKADFARSMYHRLEREHDAGDHFEIVQTIKLREEKVS